MHCFLLVVFPFASMHSANYPYRAVQHSPGVPFNRTQVLCNCFWLPSPGVDAMGSESCNGEQWAQGLL